MAKGDPLEGAALLLLSFRLRGKEQDPGFRFIYRGVLRDLGVTAAQVEEHAAAHRDRLRQLLIARGAVDERDLSE